jgi:hypothetical protein
MQQIEKAIGSYTVSVFAGDLYEAPSDAVRSYSDALFVCQTHVGKSSIVFCDRGDMHQLHNYISEEALNQFLKEMNAAIKKREPSTLASAFLRLRSNFHSEAFSPAVHHQFTDLLCDSFEKIGIQLDDLGIDVSQYLLS